MHLSISYMHIWHILNLLYSIQRVIREGNGTPLQYSCLENPMDGGAWWAAAHGVVKSRIRLSNFTFTFLHWRRKWQPAPIFLLRESCGQRSLVGCSPWGREESDTTERLHFHFSLSRIRGGNGNPLQCSCLENPGTGELGGLRLRGRTESNTTEVTVAAAAALSGESDKL